MTFDSLARADVAGFLETFGEDVTHYPDGDDGAAATVSAVVHEAAPRVQASLVSDEVVYEVLIDVAASVVVTADDAWVIDGDRWETEFNGKPEKGLRSVRLIRVVTNSTSRHPGGNL